MSKEKFRFNPFLRFFTLFIGILAIAYGIYAIVTLSPTGKLKAILPYLVVLLATNSVFRNLFTLNSITFTQEQVIFRKLAMSSFRVSYQQIVKIRFADRRMRLLQLFYSQDGSLKSYTFNLGYPAVLDALSKLKKKNPEIEFEGDLGKQVL